MNTLRSYAAIGLASAAITTGATLKYEDFAQQAAPGIEACTDKYLEQPELLDRCHENVPLTGGTQRMGILTLVGTLGIAGSIGLSLNTLRRRKD